MKRTTFEGISTKSKVSLVISCLIMGVFFVVETLLVFGLIDHAHNTWVDYFGFICICLFSVPFSIVVADFTKNKAQVISELRQKNTYLEHAAKIIRHDMHSGINTYLPRGVRSLERRLTPQQIKDLKIESPLKMLKEGLNHTQKVYKGVYEFTNLVKKDAEMSMEQHNIKDILESYLSSTSYKSQIILDESLSFKLNVNEPLFCTAIDNLIRNGLKYNDSPTKLVSIYRDGSYIIIEDNGRGMSQSEFEYLSIPYTRKKGQKEEGTGLGLNICRSILQEHRFRIKVDEMKQDIGDFYKDLARAELYHGKNPDAYVFDKESLEAVAKEDKYRGRIKMKRGGRDRSKIYVLYDNTKKNSKGTKIKIKIKNDRFNFTGR